MARYEAGETLSSIARTYDCSPPAISYIVSRSKAKPTVEIAPQPPVEPQLVKTATNGAAPNDSAPVEPTAIVKPATVAIRREPPPAPANGAAVNGDERRTLHLSLGGNGHAGTNGNGHSNDDGHSNGNGHGNGLSREAPPRPDFAAPRAPQGQAFGERMAPPPFSTPPPRNPAPFDAGRNGREPFALPEGRPAAQQPRDADASGKNGAFIDQELRSRVDGDIAAFLAAFDAALAADTQESRFSLREATDRLLRAGARTRIELERLEARVPLASRDGGAAPDPAAWRYR